jgi:hypothetical protein
MVELWPAAEEEAADGGESHGSDTMLEKNGQMPVLPVLGLHIQGPNGPKAYMGQNIYLLL